MPENADNFLVASHVYKRFGITQALGDVSVSFRRGEVHALMGENGAGKSTLGKVIAGLHRQDSGTVSVAGRVLAPGSIADAFGAGGGVVDPGVGPWPEPSGGGELCPDEKPRARAGVGGPGGGGGG